jgi:ATP-dependent DNA helicase RecG
LPEEALREALLNAIAHRDYFVSGANILVETYSNRLEITNPGGLAKGLTKQDLGKRSLSRNNLLFGLMQRMGLVEKVGSGIVRMKNAMKEYGRKGPRFDINDNWFVIIFDRPTERRSETTQKTTQKILEVIKESPNISRRELASIIGITED